MNRTAWIVLSCAALLAALLYVLLDLAPKPSGHEPRPGRADGAEMPDAAVAPLPITTVESAEDGTRDARHVPETARAKVAPGATPAAIRFTGNVLNDRNLPVRGARWRLIRFVDSERSESGMQPSDANGRIGFQVEAGTHELVITAPRHREQRVRLELDAAESRVERTIVLVGENQLFVRLEGRQGGRPSVGLSTLGTDTRFSVLATRDEPAERSVTALASLRVDTNAWPRPGAWQEDARLPIEWVLELPSERPLWVSAALGDRVLASRPISAADDVVTLVVGEDLVADVLAGLHARVVDAGTRAPLLAARFAIAGAEVRSNDVGEIRLEGLVPGHHEWELEAAEHERLHGTVELVAGTRVDIGDLELDPATTISGRVVDAEGKPLDLRLVLVANADELGELRARARKLGDVDLQQGRFRFEGVGRRRYFICVRDPVWAGEALVADTRQGDVEGLELRVAHGRTVHITGGGPGFTVLVADPEGHTRAYGAWDDEAIFALLPGSYRFRVWTADGRTFERQAESTDDGLAIELGR